jgi:hypothetical protein
MKIPKNATITVIGRRWFERVNGNTYHSCEVYVNGEEVGTVPFTYGYGNQWEYTGLDILKGKYKVPEDVSALWKLKDHGYKLVLSCTDVNRKKDL